MPPLPSGYPQRPLRLVLELVRVERREELGHQPRPHVFPVRYDEPAHVDRVGDADLPRPSAAQRRELRRGDHPCRLRRGAVRHHEPGLPEDGAVLGAADIAHLAVDRLKVPDHRLRRTVNGIFDVVELAQDGVHPFPLDEVEALVDPVDGRLYVRREVPRVLYVVYHLLLLVPARAGPRNAPTAAPSPVHMPEMAPEAPFVMSVTAPTALLAAFPIVSEKTSKTLSASLLRNRVIMMPRSSSAATPTISLTFVQREFCRSSSRLANSSFFLSRSPWIRSSSAERQLSSCSIWSRLCSSRSASASALAPSSATLARMACLCASYSASLAASFVSLSVLTSPSAFWKYSSLNSLAS